jgi:hypothetical protein
MPIDYAHSITLGRNKELYYLMIVIDSIDFTWAQPSPNRSEPEDLIHDFMTLTGIKVGHIRAEESLECGLCLLDVRNIPLSPIWQCSEGHIHCNSCYNERGEASGCG